MTEHIRITPEGEAIIPRDVCQKLGWQPGVELEIAAEGAGLCARARDDRRQSITIEEFKHRVPPHGGRPISLEEMDEAILKEAADRYLRKTARTS